MQYFDFKLTNDTRPKKDGWASGWYVNQACNECYQPFMGDKRAVTCAPCAYKDKRELPVMNLCCKCGSPAEIGDDCIELEFIGCSDHCENGKRIVFGACDKQRKIAGVSEWNDANPITQR